MSREAFLKYWEHEHGPRVAGHLKAIGCKKYVQVRSIEGSLAKKIAKTQQVFLIDLPGMGSNKNTQFIDIDQTTSEINALNLPHFSIMGWSFGGQIALHYSYKFPKKIKKLFLVSTTPCFVNQIGNWQSGVDANIFNKFANDLIADWQTTMERFLNLQLLGSEYRKTILKKLKPLFLKKAPDIDSLKKKSQFTITK